MGVLAMGVTLDDLPTFLVFTALSVAALVGGATALGVRRDITLVVTVGLCSVLGPTVFGVGPARLRSAVSYNLHRVKRTSKFTAEDKRKFDFDAVGSGLLLGRQPRHARDLEDLKAEGVTAIVTLNEPWELFVPDLRAVVLGLGMEHMHIETTDFQGPDRHSTVEASEFIFRHVWNKSGKVFVHCNAGRGRSAVVAAAYILAASRAELSSRLPGGGDHDLRWDPAAEVKRVVTEMRTHRPQVTPNLLRYPMTGQSRALRAFAVEEAAALGDAWAKRK